MAEGFKHGAGGNPLNFKVVGGTTEPSNPKENTIWINTSTPITDWVFSATQPAAVTGRVWISTGTSSPVEFNALKKNGIQVYPISAKQYLDGAWVEKESILYKGGERVELLHWTYLYCDGKEFEDITGGWVAPSIANTGQHWDHVASDGTRTIQKNADHMYIYARSANGNNAASAALYTKNKINLTPYSILCVKFEEVTGGDVSVIGYPGSTPFPFYIDYAFSGSANSNKLEIEIDISGVEQLVHVLIGGIAWKSDVSDVRMMKVKEVRVK